MLLFFTDETNFDPSTSDFFVYGGLIVPSDRALTLSDEIEEVRRAFGYAINERTDPSKRCTVAALLYQLTPLFLRDMRGRVEELSLFFSPKVIRAPSYLQVFV